MIDLLPEHDDDAEGENILFDTEDYKEIIMQLQDMAAVGEDSDDERCLASDSEDSDEQRAE